MRKETVSLDRLPGLNHFFLRLCADQEFRQRQLGYARWDQETLARFARPRALPPALFKALVRQNPGHGAALKHTLQLAGAEPVFIVTGQQAGLFTGPLYTIHKALTVLRLVEDLRARGIPAAGLFWVAGEDHDILEISSANFFPAGSQQVRLNLPLDTSRPRPVSSLILDEGVTTLVEECARLLPQTDYTPPVLEMLRNSYRPGEGMGKAFRLMMQHCFSRLGLLFFDPVEIDRQELLAGFWEPFPRLRSSCLEKVTAACHRLEAEGFHCQVEFHPQRSFLFYLHPELGRRRVVELPDGSFAVDGTGLSWPPGSWSAVLPEQAGCFSPDALLRPLMQDWLFPVAAYVGGAAEIAYHVQIRDLYPLWGLHAPLLWPRFSATYLRRSTLRKLEKHQLQPLDLLKPRETIIREVLARGGQLTALEEFQQRRLGAEAVLNNLPGPPHRYPEDVQRSLAGSLSKITGLLDKMEERLARQLRSEHAETVQRIDSLRQELFPGGFPQERHLNILPLLCLQGPRLITELFKLVDAEDLNHQLIYLEDE